MFSSDEGGCEIDGSVYVRLGCNGTAAVGTLGARPGMSDKVVDNTDLQRFEMPVDGGVAFVTYRKDGTKITLYHAEVPAELQGQGLGSELAHATLTAIRELGLKVIPRCSFMAAYMRAHPEFSDIRA
jgi:predicted GNAT family acetyltransferase